MGHMLAPLRVAILVFSDVWVLVVAISDYFLPLSNECLYM